MTTKPIAVWCVVSPFSGLRLQTVSHSRKTAIRKHFDSLLNPNVPWRTYYRDGYRCKRFILSEAEEN